jgi:quercetin dioxygenase-like cupin family protein
MGNPSLCFCELAPLYALGELSEVERAWVEDQILQEPELALELAEYQNAATALAYSTPDVGLASTLKNRLFEQIGIPLPEPALSVSPPEPEVDPFWIVPGHTITWKPHRYPGFEIAIFHVNKQSRIVSGLLRAEPGACYPEHLHTGVEEIYMLEGDLRIGTTVYGPGDYIRSSPGSIHAPDSPSGCKFFFHACLDDEYLESLAVVGSRS